MSKYSGPYRSDFPTECVMELAGLLRNPSEIVERRQWAVKDWREVSDWALGVTVGDPPDIEGVYKADEPTEEQVEALRGLAESIQDALPRGEVAVQNFAARGWREIVKWIMDHKELILTLIPLFLSDE